jgi:site-specific recombinase XerD
MLYRRKRPDGSLAPTWWVKYYVNGRPKRESTNTTKENEAKRFLKEREGRVVTGQPIIRCADRIRYEEIAADLRQHYETTGTRNLKEADVRLRALKPFFTNRRVADIDGPLVSRYIAARQAQGVTNGAINRELATLIKMLRFAYENQKLVRLPVIRKLKEADPRSGFFEPAQFAAVRRHLRPDLQVAVTIAYTFGWRVQSEGLTLTLAQMDLDVGTLRLEPGTTKNGDGRTVYLTPELRALLVAQAERVKQLSRRLNQVVPYVFPHLTGPHVGDRLRNFRKAWATGCKRVGLVGMLRHDMRRSAVRNLVNAGVPERVAMTITGHKTRAVFDRYHIVAPEDLKDAARKFTGTFTGTIASSGLDASR